MTSIASSVIPLTIRDEANRHGPAHLTFAHRHHSSSSISRENISTAYTVSATYLTGISLWSAAFGISPLHQCYSISSHMPPDPSRAQQAIGASRCASVTIWRSGALQAKAGENQAGGQGAQKMDWRVGEIAWWRCNSISQSGHMRWQSNMLEQNQI